MVDTANTAAESHDSKPLRVGLDIGSTTVKAVVLDQTNALNDVLFSDYRRHHANVRATVLDCSRTSIRRSSTSPRRRALRSPSPVPAA